MDNQENELISTGSGGRVTFERRGDHELSIVSHVCSTRVADAFEAIDERLDRRVLLWVLRHPLDDTSPGIARFRSRFEKILTLGLRIPPVLRFGIDSSNKPYVAMEFVKGSFLLEAKLSMREREKHFVDAVRLVKTLHEAGLVLGDICASSFLLTRNGSLYLVGVMGSYEVDAGKTALLPASETLRYLSPEQRAGREGDMGADIYALGVLGYQLFTGQPLYGNNPPAVETPEEASACPAPSVLADGVSVWADDVLGSCLELQHSDRIKNAMELFAVLTNATTHNVSPGGNGRWSKRTLAVRAKKSAKQRPEAASSEQYVERPLFESHTSKKSGSSLWIAVGVGGVVCVLLAVVVALLFANRASDSSGNSASLAAVSEILDGAPTEVKSALGTVFNPRNVMDDRVAALEFLLKSKDPTVMPIIASTAKDIQEVELHTAFQRLMSERLTSRALNNSALLFKFWYDSLRRSGVKPAERAEFAYFMRATDTALPLEARRVAVQRAYTEDASFALQLAAALAFDSVENEEFLPVLRQVVGVHLGRRDLESHGMLALLGLHPPLMGFFESAVKTALPMFSTPEVLQAMTPLAETQNELLFAFADEVLRRGVLPPFESVFLQSLISSDRFAIDKNVQRALVAGFRGEMSERDIAALGRWMSVDVESVLLAVCAISKDKEIALAAFDTLAAKSLETEPSRSLVGWVKRSFWDNRHGLVKAIGIFGHLDIASLEQVEYAFDLLVPYTGSGALLRAIMKTERANLIKIALDRIGESTPNDILLGLLSHENKDVRIAGVKALAGRNALGVLQGIVKEYNREQDEEVREVYQQHHWATRNR